MSPEARRYSMFVGLAFVVVIGIAAVNMLSTEGGGILGASAGDRGERLARFAVPDARSDLIGDANVFQSACSTAEQPCPEDSRRTAACQVDVEGAIRVCDLWRKPLAISFLFLRGTECLDAQDAFDRAARRFRGRASFLILDVRDERDELRQVIAEHGWRVPVGWDADGAVSDLYRVGVCPTVQYIAPGGRFVRADFGEEVNERTISRHVQALIRGADDSGTR